MKQKQFESKYYALFHKALDAIVLFDPSSLEVVEINAAAARMTGMNFKQFVKWGLNLFFDKDTIEQALKKTIASKKSQQLNAKLTLPQHKTISVSVHLDFLKMTQKTVLIMIIRDLSPLEEFESLVRKTSDDRISDLKIALESLHKTNQLKSDFVSMVSHEIRNPLSVLKNAMEMLKMRKLPQNKKDELVDIASHHIERMIAISENLLDISKIEAGVMHYHFEKVSIQKLLTEIVQHFMTLAKDADIRLTSECEKDVYAYADQHKTEQVLNNLVSNALKVTPAKGRVVIYAQKLKTGHVEIGVKDTGPGIPPEKMKLLFNRFSRVHTNLKGRDTVKGTGLGLNISKSLVQAQGGSIWAESEVGRGASFKFLLPQTGIPIIAVVEEDLQLCSLMSDFLESEGFQVEQCHTAFRFIEECQRLQPNLVVLSTDLPDLDSTEIVKRVQELPQFKDLPFIILKKTKKNKTESLKNTQSINVKDWENKLMEKIKQCVQTQVRRELG